jgi:serine/arginine repetitive matrix protein 2
MPSLTSLFSRKSKSSTNDHDSQSKLRIPFTRKKQSTPSPPTPSVSVSDSSSVIKNPRLRPPPSKSAIFVAYADPAVALSTRSLPDSHHPPPPLPLSLPPKPSFFNWGSDSKSPPQEPQDKSFNLRAFRHVAGSDVSVNRPRGTSVTSESSQRISVAAFREAQARRSTPDSLLPSPYGSTPSSPNFGSTSQSNHNLTAAKRRSSNLAFTSESDDESTEEDESDDSDHKHADTMPIHGGIRRQRTVTKRISSGTDRSHFRATRSETGHGSTFRQSNAHAPFPPVAASGSTTDLGSTPARSQSSLGFNPGAGRQRASASVSAAIPNTPAKRASAAVGQFLFFFFSTDADFWERFQEAF